MTFEKEKIKEKLDINSVFNYLTPGLQFVLEEYLIKFRHQARLNALEDKIKLLEAYSKWLEKAGYLDCDWWAEEPRAIDEFIKTLK